MFSPVFCLDTPPELGLKAIAFTLHQLSNETRGPALADSLARLRRDLKIQASLAQIEGFHTLRRRLGLAPQRFPASPQWLLDQYLRRGALPTIFPIVDLYNHWSLQSGLSIGAHDLRYLTLPVTLGLTTGTERFRGLGSDQASLLPAGEHAYLDARGQVICRMEYRQCAETALRCDTTAVLFIIQGHQDTEPELLRQTAEHLKRDLVRCCMATNRQHGQLPPRPCRATAEANALPGSAWR